MSYKIIPKTTLMQSIYRFRKAEVEIFSRVQKYGIGDLKLESLFLKVNFRSNKSIINWLNSSYSKVFPLLNIADEGSIPYSRSESNDNNTDHGIFLKTLISPAETTSELYEAEAIYVLDLIKDIKRNNDDADIAVLTRSRKHLNELITLINKKESSLPIDAIEISKIQSNQTFQDIYSLTKALYSLNDRVNWISKRYKKIDSEIVSLKNIIQDPENGKDYEKLQSAIEKISYLEQEYLILIEEEENLK